MVLQSRPKILPVGKDLKINPQEPTPHRKVSPSLPLLVFRLETVPRKTLFLEQPQSLAKEQNFKDSLEPTTQIVALPRLRPRPTSRNPAPTYLLLARVTPSSARGLGLESRFLEHTHLLLVGCCPASSRP